MSFLTFLFQIRFVPGFKQRFCERERRYLPFKRPAGHPHKLRCKIGVPQDSVILTYFFLPAAPKVAVQHGKKFMRLEAAEVPRAKFQRPIGQRLRPSYP